ncbi:Cof-type HAD-IIB family hydrolase [soil metagenome]
MQDHPAPPFDLAAFDLDGTILPHGAKITDRTVAAVNLLRESGARVVVATGRRFEGAREHAHRLGLRDPDPVICYNGAMVRRMNGETLLHRTLPKSLSIEFLEWAEPRNLHARVFTDGEIALGPETAASRKHLRHPDGPGVFTVDSAIRWLEGLDPGPIKLALTDSPGGVESWFEEARETFAGELFITRSHPYYVEIMSPESSKSQALSFLCKHRNIDPKRVLAFGDADNDIDMLRFAGHGVAVDPMTKEVREAADAIIEQSSGGVASYLEEMLKDGL